MHIAQSCEGVSLQSVRCGEVWGEWVTLVHPTLCQLSIIVSHSFIHYSLTACCYFEICFALTCERVLFFSLYKCVPLCVTFPLPPLLFLWTLFSHPSWSSHHHNGSLLSLIFGLLCVPHSKLKVLFVEEQEQLGCVYVCYPTCASEQWNWTERSGCFINSLIRIWPFDCCCNCSLHRERWCSVLTDWLSSVWVSSNEQKICRRLSAS
jgi:hypothetical protein